MRCLLLVALSFVWSAEASAFTVTNFVPEGETPNVRQIQIEFSEHMVPFGDPTGAKRPFDANSCESKGEGRWIDSKHWVFDFRKDLPAGVSCSLHLDPALKAMGGSSLAGGATFSFFTGGPAIMDSRPDGYGVAEDAAFVLTLNSEYDPATILKFAYFQVPGIASKVPLKIIAGTEREQILKEVFRWDDKPDAEGLKRIVIVQPTLLLPAGKKVKLVFGPGVATPQGIARTKAQIQEYKINDPFVVKMDCERENAKAGCVPITPIRVNFGMYVPKGLAQGIRLGVAGGASWKPTVEENEDYVYGVEFKGPFPEKSTLELTLPAGFTNDAGRAPVNAKSFPLKFKTAGAPPLAKFAARFGILEAAHPMLPITVRNVEAEIKTRSYVPTPRAEDKNFFLRWYDRLKGQIFRIPNGKTPDVLAWLDKVMRIEREYSVFDEGQKQDGFDPKLALKDKAPRLADLKLSRQDGKPFEVIGLDLGPPGFYVVETESKLLGSALLEKAGPMYVSTAALVTNLAVHFKLARASSLVWVTSLDNGAPVGGALVSVWDCEKKLYFKGKANSDGYVVIDAELPKPDTLPTCFKGNDSYPSAFGRGYFVVAEKGDDFSFTHSSWDGGIETWRFNLPYVEDRDDVALHSVLDRSLLRAGDKINIKSVLRQRTATGFAMLPPDLWPKKLVLTHAGSEQKYELPMEFDKTGVAVNDWQLPADAKLGTYTITAYLPTDKKGEEDSWQNRLAAGDFRVEDFRIPLAKGLLSSGGAVLVRPTSVKFDLGVQYLSGGSAGNQSVTFRARLARRASVQFADFEGFSFAEEPVKVGDSERRETEPKPVELHQGSVTLGPTGTASVTVDDIPERPVPFVLESELEYKDPSGEIQTVSKTQTLWPTDVVVGIKSEGWTAAKGNLKLKIAVVDKNGKGVAGRDVKVRLFKQKDFSHRKRLVGGFYSYDSVTRVTALKEDFCAGKTSAKGEWECTGKSPASGYVVAEAYLVTGGKTAAASTQVYVPGKGVAEFAQEEGDRIDLVPEKKVYEPGEKASIQVRMPFRQAYGLVVVEREGIQSVKLQKLDGKAPSVEVDVKDEYAPNTYVSVMAVRGRVEKPEADFLVDLAKPAFKLGVVSLKVGRKAYTLDVAVETDKKTYQARDEVEGSVVIKPQSGKLEGDAEAAIAVIDEGLLQLKPNASWNLLEAMTGQRGDTAQTFTSALQVIGKRHFGLKAVPPGGGGGVEATRSMFDAMVFWQPRLPLDGSGRAKFKFKLNDSLTSFKVVAIAQAGAQKFGTGSTSIAATKNVMLLPGVPPTARGGDKLKASFTLRNTTKTPRNLVVKLDVKGLKGKLKEQALKLKGDSAEEVSWQIVVPLASGELEYTAAVEDGGKLADRLVVKQKIKPAVPLRTNQATLEQLAPGATLDLKMPEGAEAGRSRLLVSLSPTLAGEFAGVRQYMSDYPYSCFEQRLSKSVALRDDKAFSDLLSALPAYLDGDGFIKYYPTSLWGSPVLTAYFLQITHELGQEVDESTRSQIFGALKGFLGGRLHRNEMSFAADLVMKKLLVLDALSRYGEANAEDLDSFDHDPTLWPTSSLIDWIGVLKRLPETDRTKEDAATAVKLLKARMTYRGTTFGFSTDEHDFLWWLMVSPDVNAVRALLLGLEFPVFGDDVPKMTKATLARQGRSGHWDLTNANAFGVIALRKFADRFEKDKVKGETMATLGKEAKTLDWDEAEKGGRLELAWAKDDAKFSVTHKGGGKPWAQIESKVAMPLKAPIRAGFGIVKEVTASRAKEPGKWHVGDVVKVKLKIDAQGDTGFVVVDDPIPSGSSILGTGLGGNADEPAADSDDEGYWGRTWPVYRENTFEGVKVYYDEIHKGEFTVEYAFRLNNAGTFMLPPTHVEAMYAPDTFGDSPNASWQVLD